MSALTEEEFEEFMAADETILELSLNVFSPTLYNYKQAKQLLLRFHLQFTRGVKKERMMADLLLLQDTTQRARATEAAPTAAAANPKVNQEDADDKPIETLTLEQVEASNAKEELLFPTSDVERSSWGGDCGTRRQDRSTGKRDVF